MALCVCVCVCVYLGVYLYTFLYIWPIHFGMLSLSYTVRGSVFCFVFFCLFILLPKESMSYLVNKKWKFKAHVSRRTAYPGKLKNTPLSLLLTLSSPPLFSAVIYFLNVSHGMSMFLWMAPCLQPPGIKT